jgi:hypothetical protein
MLATGAFFVHDIFGARRRRRAGQGGMRGNAENKECRREKAGMKQKEKSLNASKCIITPEGLIRRLGI